ncbi:unnamed protein product [Protopolystoma xenopodis]|uniref:Uncharacterized protein n=1 Tax=Protopolystoma xenopodis TaxID=117903 RepID=A0A3S5FGD9_9PLAT|nr:unnamed protein product [Protopolystoma xenopodis]
MDRLEYGDYEKEACEMEEKPWICLPSCPLARKLRPMIQKWKIRTIMNGRTTVFASLSTQLEDANKIECSGAYRINCNNCKKIGEIGRTTKKE